MSLKTVKCPCSDCGYVYRIDAEKVTEDGRTAVVRTFKQDDAPRQNPEEYIDLVCPKCNRGFEWKIT